MTIADHVARAEELLAQADELLNVDVGVPTSITTLLAAAEAHVAVAEALARHVPQTITRHATGLTGHVD
jgi:hypothetical protein